MGGDGFPGCVLTWKHWDMPSGPPICALRASAPRTSDNDSGLLPTLTASDGEAAAVLNENTQIHYTKNRLPRKTSNNGVEGSVGLARFVQLMPTRTAKAGMLAPSMQKWPLHRNLFQTPTSRATGATKAVRRGAWSPVRHSLESMARHNLFPTPTSTLGSNGGLVTPSKAREGGTLIEAVSARMWPTPTVVTDTGGAALCKWGGSGARAKLKTMVSPQEFNGSLNPTWVAWLMGYPPEWLNCAPSATPSSRKSRRNLSAHTSM